MLCFLLLSCASEHSRRGSPDGRFEVVVTTSVLSGLLPASPGQGSDKPGRVAIVRVEDGVSCGTAALPMVQLAGDIRFSETTATLVGVATWDLAACTIDTSGW